VDHLISHFSSKAVSRKHVNLVDLVAGFRETLLIFKSEKELSEYTKATKKFFPKEDAADGGVLRALRRQIWVPRESRPRQHQHQRQRPLDSHDRHPVESVPFNSSSSFQGLQGCNWGSGPALPYHVILATYLQLQYTTLGLPSRPLLTNLPTFSQWQHNGGAI